ncbi:MAG: MFS transporter [Candidatus Caldarchaeum sp.]
MNYFRDAVSKTFSYFVGIGRNSSLLIAGQALLSFQMGVMALVFPIYFAKTGLDGVQIGFLIAAAQLTGAVASLPFGIYADRKGRKKFVLLGSALSGASFILYALVQDFAHLILISIVLGVASGMGSSAFSAWLANSVSSEKRNAVFSLNAAVSSALFVVSSLLGILPSMLRTGFGFGELDSYRPLIALPGFLAFVALVIFQLAEDKKVVQNRRMVISNQSIQVLTKYGIVNSLVSLGAGLVIPLFSYWFFLRFGVEEDVLAPLFGISNLMLLFSFLLAPRIADRFGAIRTIVATQMSSTALLVLIPLSPDYTVVSVLYVFRALLMNMANPLITALILSVINPDERATASSISTITWSIPNALTTPLGGYLMENVSLSAPFFLCGILYASAITMFYYFFRKSVAGTKSDDLL